MTARERFEAWMRKHNVDSQAVLWRDEHFPDCYHYGATEAAWQAWQAAEAAERERWTAEIERQRHVIGQLELLVKRLEGA